MGGRPDRFRGQTFVGDAVQDLIALGPDKVAVTYFDEGIGEPLSEEGVAILGVDGTLHRGFVSSGGEPIMDFYAAVKVGSQTIGFWPYTSWRLTEWSFTTGAERTHVVPGTVRGASAVTQLGDDWWFFSPYGKPAHCLQVASRLIKGHRRWASSVGRSGPERWSFPGVHR